MSEIREIAAARADKGGGQMPLRAAEAKARGDAARFLTRAETAGVGTSEGPRRGSGGADGRRSGSRRGGSAARRGCARRRSRPT
jgi:hypothetical protein